MSGETFSDPKAAQKLPQFCPKLLGSLLSFPTVARAFYSRTEQYNSQGSSSYPNTDTTQESASSSPLDKPVKRRRRQKSSGAKTRSIKPKPAYKDCNSELSESFLKPKSPQWGISQDFPLSAPTDLPQTAVQEVESHTQPSVLSRESTREST